MRHHSYKCYSKLLIIMSRQIKRRQRPIEPHRKQIKRRSKPWIYTYNYNDKKFLKYFISKTGIMVGKEDKPTLSHFLLSNKNADHWLKTSSDFRYTTGKMIPFGKDREEVIKWHNFLRDMLQDSWQEYKNKPRKIKRRK